MSLSAGTRLGPYEILSPLGAGGMGEVYRARDTRLDRDVAIKVLPEGFAADLDRRARFEREAKSVAALSHPNILAIHDVGTAGAETYAVTELLDGETLRHRLKAGALPVRKAIDYAVQMARGLAAAHDKGVVHRDLKPENLFLLKDGQLKILDFGLARHTASSAGGSETLSAVTEPGAVMGTVGYMAPEQVRGQAVDARTDLFAFGLVLYEMLSGRRAFQRETGAETMTAILTADPPEFSGARNDIPPALDHIVRHSLEKNPAERFQSARDMGFALETLSRSQMSLAPDAVAPGLRRWRAVAAAGLLLVVVAAVAYAVWTRLRPQSPLETLVFEPKTWDPQFITNARFAPNGTVVFSAARSGNQPQVYVIQPGSVASQPIGPPNTHLLSVSAKGELAVITGGAYIGHRLFEGTLAIMTLEGSVPQPRTEHVREADWAPDGVTLAVIRSVGGVDQLECPTGTILYSKSGGYLSDPRVSPDGAHIAFAEHARAFDDNGNVRIVDRTGKTSQVSEEFFGIEGMAWLDGHRILFSASSLVGGQQILPWIINADGPLQPRIAVPAAEWTFVQDASAGRLLLTQEDLRVSPWAKRKTDAVEHEYAFLNWATPSLLSRDGRKLVISDQSQTAGVDYAVRLFNTDAPAHPSKLGDGIVLGLSPNGEWAIAQVPSSGQLMLLPTGTGEPRKLARGPIEQYVLRRESTAWLSDGLEFLFCGNEPGRPPRCYRQSIADNSEPAPISEEGFVSAKLAPDDRTLLLRRMSGESVIGSLTDRGTRPAKGLTREDGPIAWSRDGRAVFVAAGMGVPLRIDRVDLDTGNRTTVGRLAPPDRAGVVSVLAFQWIDDGAAYLYSSSRDLSKLFVAMGLGNR
jgi:hypothetical protein